jgi:hypothetical protein
MNENLKEIIEWNGIGFIIFHATPIFDKFKQWKLTLFLPLHAIIFHQSKHKGLRNLENPKPQEL